MQKFNVQISANNAEEFAKAADFSAQVATAHAVNPFDANVAIFVGETAPNFDVVPPMENEQVAQVVADAYEYRGRKYAKVKRMAQENELILIVDSNSGYYDDGDVKAVGAVRGNSVWIIDKDRDAVEVDVDEYVVLEPLF